MVRVSQRYYAKDEHKSSKVVYLFERIQNLAQLSVQQDIMTFYGSVGDLSSLFRLFGTQLEFRKLSLACLYSLW